MGFLDNSVIGKANRWLGHKQGAGRFLGSKYGFRQNWGENKKQRINYSWGHWKSGKKAAIDYACGKI